MPDNLSNNKLNGPGLAFQPLYKQVAEHVKQLIVERRWKPGDMLPNEFDLAKEIGVSQGTARKALNILTDEKILTRRQGVGTFVSEYTAKAALFRFFPLHADGHTSELPTARLLDIRILSADEKVRDALQLSSQDKVVYMQRLRFVQGEVCMLENVYLPASYFPDLDKETDIPHTLYHFYQTRFGITVHKTQDSIKAVLADKQQAGHLGIAEQQPILQVSRLTLSIDDKYVEYRVSLCRSDHYHYLVELS